MNSASQDRIPAQHAFPTVAALAALTAAAAATGASAFAIVAQTVEIASARSGVLFAVVVVWVTSLLAVVPVALVGRRGVTATMVAYFAGMAGRMMICLAAALVAVMVLELPATPTLLSMAAAYMVLLLVEVAFVGRHLTGKDSNVEPAAATKLRQGPGAEVTA